MDVTFMDLTGNRKNFLYQYDKGQILVVENLECQAKPEVHFTTSAFNAAIVAEDVTFTNGTLKAKIPDALLFNSTKINVYLYLTNVENKGETFKELDLFVKPRKKPDDYIYSDELYVIGVGSLRNAIKNYIDNNYQFIEDIVIDYTKVTLTDDSNSNIKYELGVNNGKLYTERV